VLFLFLILNNIIFDFLRTTFPKRRLTIALGKKVTGCRKRLWLEQNL